MNEAQKKSIMMAILAFNLTFILYTFLFNYGEQGRDFSLLKVLLGLLIAAGAAAGGYFGAKMIQ